MLGEGGLELGGHHGGVAGGVEQVVEGGGQRIALGVVEVEAAADAAAEARQVRVLEALGKTMVAGEDDAEELLGVEALAGEDAELVEDVGEHLLGLVDDEHRAGERGLDVLEREVARIRARIARAEAEFYAVGKMLLGLDRPEVLAAFEAKSFAAFLDAHVMPAGTANRYMTVAREFEADQAAALGVLKGFHLVQYARVAPTRLRAAVLAKRDAKIGKPARRLSTMTAAEVADAVRQVKMDAGRAALPRATVKERRAAQRLVTEFEERFGMDATMRIDKKRGVLRLEVKLSDLVE